MKKSTSDPHTLMYVQINFLLMCADWQWNQSRLEGFEISQVKCNFIFNHHLSTNKALYQYPSHPVST